MTYRGLHDMAGWWEWTADAVRMENTVESYRPFIEPGDLVFDIGANRGQKVYVFRELLGARVVAVDPLYSFRDEFVPEFFWKYGNDPGVIWVPRAVSPEAVVTIQVNMFIPEVSSIDTRWMTESAHAPKFGESYYRPSSLIPREVYAIRLDALIALYGVPDFLKVDVEGAEDDVFSTLTRPVPALNMEFHADWIPVRALERMDALAAPGGYQWNYCLDNRGGFVLPEWVCRGKLLDILKQNLTKSGTGSWGDIYGRL
jgi:FkbM family methyltransferase